MGVGEWHWLTRGVCVTGWRQGAVKQLPGGGALLRRAANKSTIHDHHPLMPEMSLRDLQPEIPRSASPQSSDSTRRLHSPLRAAWGVGADASIPPEMLNSCPPRCGLNEVLVGGTRDCEGLSRDDEWLQQPRVPHQHHEPGQHQGSKPTTLCRVRFGLKSCSLHLHGVGWTCD